SRPSRTGPTPASTSRTWPPGRRPGSPSRRRSSRRSTRPWPPVDTAAGGGDHTHVRYVKVDVRELREEDRPRLLALAGEAFGAGRFYAGRGYAPGGDGLELLLPRP